MAKLAAYDKYRSPNDKKMAEFFRHDYVYRRNMGTRFFTLLGSLIVIMFYFMHRIIIDHLDILDITGQVTTDLIKAGIFLILVQVLYTLLGYLRYTREYNEAQRRIGDYYENMRLLTKRQLTLEQKTLYTNAKEGALGLYDPDDGDYPEY